MTHNIYAITASTNYINQALEEVIEIDKELKVIQNYDNGILLIEISIDKDIFDQMLLRKKPVFIRHVSAFDIKEFIDENTTPADIAALAENYSKEIKKASKVAVQVRKARGDYYFNPVDIKTQIDKMLEELGAEAEVKEPEQIISILLDEDVVYMGLGSSVRNLSSWSGGMIHYKKEAADISRAKFKLMEAITVFQLDLSKVRNALDLGAAPGGWTSVLLERGIGVTAVDTGEMDSRLNKYKNYTYIKANASELELPDESFDLLTSDVSWNAKNTAVIVNNAARFLKSGGYAVVTVKLMSSKVRRTIREVSEIYREVFDILQTKQLFHNRDEITLLLKKR